MKRKSPVSNDRNSGSPAFHNRPVMLPERSRSSSLQIEIAVLVRTQLLVGDEINLFDVFAVAKLVHKSPAHSDLPSHSCREEFCRRRLCQVGLRLPLVRRYTRGHGTGAVAARDKVKAVSCHVAVERAARVAWPPVQTKAAKLPRTREADRPSSETPGSRHRSFGGRASAHAFPSTEAGHRAERTPRETAPDGVRRHNRADATSPAASRRIPISGRADSRRQRARRRFDDDDL